MLLGTDIAAALTILEGLPIDVIGLNCSTGPEHMREPIRFLGENATLPVSCIPNAGLPLNVDGEAVYPLGAGAICRGAGRICREERISVVGGCCGTTPEHLKLLVERWRTTAAPPRARSRHPRLSSAHPVDPYAPGPAALADRRALQLPGQPQVQAHCCWPRTTTAFWRSPATRSTAARTRWMSGGGHRARGRSRPDAQRGQEAGAGRSRCRW